MWSADSSFSLQRLHQLTIDQPLLINILTVEILPQIASQVKKCILKGTYEPQTSCAGNKGLLSTFKDL